MAPLKYSGSAMFRQRIVATILSNKQLKIDKIRVNDQITPGLQDFEANFLRLIEQITDGTRIEINETGTVLRLKPGILVGGKITHDCGLSRSMGWFVEGILPLAPFCKYPLQLTLTGLTNDEIDMSVDILQNVTFPILQNFGIYGVNFKIKKRGVPPKGGGMIELSIPTVRASLNPVYIVDEGLIKRVRGVAFCTRISPTIVTRVIESCRKVLNDFLPDVHIHSDHYKGGKDGGDSPGYSLSLIAETTTGALLSVERTAKTRRNNPIPGMQQEDDSGNNQIRYGEMPEDVGIDGAMMLMKEIFSGGVIDSMHQSLILQLMVLTPEDVSKVRFGSLTPQAIETLRLLRDAFGVVFRIKEETQVLEKVKNDRKSTSKIHNSYGSDEEDENEMDEDEEDEDDEMDVDSEEVDDDEQNSKEDEVDDNEEEKSEDEESDEDESIEEESENESQGGEENTAELETRVTYLLSCLGTGYTNVNRRVT